MARTATKDKPELVAKEAVANDVDAIKADVSALRDDLRALIADAGKVAKLKSERGVEHGKEIAGSAQESLEKTKATLEDKVRERPFAAIGIALGAGFLMSALTRR